MFHHAIRLARQAGLDIRSVRRHPNLMDFLASRQIDLVLDVGANTGQFATYLRRLGYRGEILSFEPLVAAFETLQLAAKRDPRWRALNIALGAVSEERVLNVAEATLFSSLLETTDAAKRFDSHSRAVATQPVRVEPLGGLGIDLAGRAAFLKIDTQGSEREVLEGARSIIHQFQGVLLELPIVRLYEGTWSASQAIDYMADLGFALAQAAPVNFDPQDRVSAVEFDCLFRRLG